MNKIQLAVLLSAATIAVNASNYDEALSLKAAHYSGTAYCLYELIDQWNCGGHCEKNPGVNGVKRAFDPDTRTMGYTGYDPNYNQIVVSFRGTNGADGANWMTNLDGRMEPYQQGGKIHKGFFTAYGKLRDQVRPAVQALIQQHPSASLLFTGHSLGGALATVAAADIKQALNPSTTIKVYTFGQPRVGDDQFADYIMKTFEGNFYRVVHYDDGIPHQAPRTFGWKHAGDEVWYPAKDHDDDFMVCKNTPGKKENQKCSHSLFIKMGVDAHLYYLGLRLGEQCSIRQPSGTLLLDPASFQISNSDSQAPEEFLA